MKVAQLYAFLICRNKDIAALNVTEYASILPEKFKHFYYLLTIV